MSVSQFNEYNQHYRYYVYSLFCQDTGGAGYVKFGRSRRIDLRISQLRTGCPIPIKMVGLIEVFSEDRQIRTEKALHAHFKDRRVSGEWFKFNFSSPEDKREFNDGCKKVFVEHLKKRDDQYWSTINVKVLDAISADKRKRFLALPEKFKKLARMNAKQRKAVTCK